MTKQRKKTGYAQTVEALLKLKAPVSSAEYSDYLKKNGINVDSSYQAAIDAATARYAMNKSGYGTRAESLASMGLAQSGYADRVDALAERALKDDVQKASDSALTSLESSVRGYEAVVAAKEAEEERIYTKATEQIIKAKLLNYDDAYRLAIELGLNEKSAAAAATEARDTVRKNVKEEALKVIVSKELTSGQAREYGYALGLPSSDVKELMEYAASINESAYPYGYYNYIKDKVN